MKHILWDWNGTLLDDTDACVGALGVLLSRRGLPPIDRAFFRAHFAFPARTFYAQVGMRLEGEDWNALAREYHDAYAGQSKALNRETFAALEAVKAAGVAQSIISALRQDLLSRITAETGVAPYMDFIYGTDNLDGASKVDRARDLLSALGSADVDARAGVVLIGDSLHDKEVADALGVRCVLHGQGSHDPSRLAPVAPTAATLTEAVRLALRMLSGEGGI